MAVTTTVPFSAIPPGGEFLVPSNAGHIFQKVGALSAPATSWGDVNAVRRTGGSGAKIADTEPVTPVLVDSSVKVPTS